MRVGGTAKRLLACVQTQNAQCYGHKESAIRQLGNGQLGNKAIKQAIRVEKADCLVVMVTKVIDISNMSAMMRY